VYPEFCVNGFSIIGQPGKSGMLFMPDLGLATPSLENTPSMSQAGFLITSINSIFIKS
jgi:hypothetical protein